MRLLRGINPVPTEDKRNFNKNTNKNIWQVYFPLALSWFFMAWEGQLAMWLVGQMPNSKVYQAGFLIVMGIAIFVESPVIDLLSTGTTLGTTKARFQSLTKFSLILMLWVTVAHCAVVFTPLYPIVAEQVLDAPPHVAQAAWYGLAWMPIWSAGVGWRRYRQGIMIRAGKTGPISWGTLIRMSVMFIVGFALFKTGTMTGLGVIGIAFTIAVLAEATYIHFASLPVINNLPDQPDETTPKSNTGPLSIPNIFKFHIPLTASTLLMLTTPIFLTRALNQGAQPVVAMAAWQIASTVVWLFRSVTFALPEAVISLYQTGREKLLFRFTFQVGVSISALMVLMHVTGIDHAVFVQVFQAEPIIAERAAIAFLWTSLVPVLNSVMAYYRGLLTAHHVTSARMLAIAVALIGLGASLTLGLRFNPLSVVLAAASLTVAHIVELATLAISWHRSPHNPKMRSAGTP